MFKALTSPSNAPSMPGTFTPLHYTLTGTHYTPLIILIAYTSTVSTFYTFYTNGKKGLERLEGLGGLEGL
jgi:hypothetical protein